MSAKLKHSEVNMFELASGIELEEEPINLEGERPEKPKFREK